MERSKFTCASARPAWMKLRDFLAKCIFYVELPERVRRLETTLEVALQKIDQIQRLQLDKVDQLWERSRIRWKSCPPTEGLTWGRLISGDAFISKMFSYRAFKEDLTVLEVGPGYGRLLKSLLEHGLPFKRYVGVDMSAANIKYLRERFRDDRINFLQGDIETIILEDKFDIAFSSLTFKHLFPTFERALANISNHMRHDGYIFFDLIEGSNTGYFEPDGVTFIRHYTREEILSIIARLSLEFVAFDQVEHDSNHVRLLVVARKP